MRNFSIEKGYKNKDNAAEIMHEEHLKLPKNMPFSLEDLRDVEYKAPTIDSEEAAGKSFIEREDGINEVNMIQTRSLKKAPRKIRRGLNVDALLMNREDLRPFDGSGVYIQFESSEDGETKFNNALAKELNITAYGSNKFLNEDNQIDFTFFPKKHPEDAEEAVQAINAIVDEGDAAEEQLEADTAEAEANGDSAEI